MIFTDWISKNCMEKPSILTKDDFQHFDKSVWDDNGKTLKSCLYDPKNVTFFFDKGFVIFNIYYSDTDYNNNDIICDLVAFYRAKVSKLSRKECLDNFWNFLKVNKCTKVNMSTTMNPDFWIKKYGFKLKRYEMELKLRKEG